MTDLPGMLEHAVARLDQGGVPDEALAMLRGPRRIGPVLRGPKFIAQGRAWRLGVLLLSRNGELYATGTVTRAIVPKDFAANKSPAEEARRELQRAAARGPFSRGESVNHGYRPALGDTVIERDGALLLRLPDAEVPLETYLDDRIRTALEPRGV
ncbi:hypothetical protein [Schumannella luteola]